MSQEKIAVLMIFYEMPAIAISLCFALGFLKIKGGYSDEKELEYIYGESFVFVAKMCLALIPVVNFCYMISIWINAITTLFKRK